MSFFIGDSVLSAEALPLTLISKSSEGKWIAMDSSKSMHEVLEANIERCTATHEFNGLLLDRAKLWADRVDEDNLTRLELPDSLVDTMNRFNVDIWMSSDGTLWEWNLQTLEMYRNGVYFALRLMTPCGEWI